MNATHFVLIKKFLGWDKRVMTLRDGGFNILDYGLGHTDWIQFKDVISLNYQFGTANEISIVWNK
jgi:queuine/archaeosine tRNA-ribosyltransferase